MSLHAKYFAEARRESGARHLRRVIGMLSAIALRPRPHWAEWFAELQGTGRASELHAVGADGEPAVRWVATERRDEVAWIHPDAPIVPDHPVPDALRRPDVSEDGALLALVRGLLDISGPLTAEPTGAPWIRGSDRSPQRPRSPPRGRR